MRGFPRSFWGKLEQAPDGRVTGEPSGPHVEAAEVEQAEGIVTFRFGARRYLYDRLGLRSGDLTP